VKAITEALCGRGFSASTVSAIDPRLDESLAPFAERPLDEAYPDLILDARYEKVRDHGVVRSQAVRVAIGMNGESRRRVLGVERANRESASRWKDFLVILKARGLKGVEFGVSDDHAGLKRASAEVLPEAAWQHCDVHFLRTLRDMERVSERVE
jgi:transposase-like protein